MIGRAAVEDVTVGDTISKNEPTAEATTSYSLEKPSKFGPYGPINRLLHALTVHLHRRLEGKRHGILVSSSPCNCISSLWFTTATENSNCLSVLQRATAKFTDCQIVLFPCTTSCFIPNCSGKSFRFDLAVPQASVGLKRSSKNRRTLVQ